MTDDHCSPSQPNSERFRIERTSAGDFPFYSGSPVALSGPQWLIVLMGVALGFASLIMPIAPKAFYQTTAGSFLPAVLLFAIPLLALAGVAGRALTTLFRPLASRDFLLMLVIALANLVVTIVLALLLLQLFDMNANPVGDMLSAYSGTERALFYLKSIPQLFGEEVVSVLPFLALLWFCHSKLNMPRKQAVMIAWLGAALFFGAIHLPTYGWNFLQCFLVIGTARVVLLAGYIITRNIWVSTGAHIINDWVIFSVVLLAGPQAIA